jgi:hypothetical protein
MSQKGAILETVLEEHHSVSKCIRQNSSKTNKILKTRAVH